MQHLSQTDTRVLWAVKILLGLCLLTPLLMSSVFLFPYTAPKAFAFRILVELAAMGYFYLVLKYPRRFLTFLFREEREGKVSWGSRLFTGGILSWSVLIFLFVNFLSAVFGVDFYSSWWGNLERMAGVWGLLHFVLFFLMLAAVFRTRDDWRALIKLSVGASAVVALLAVIQRVTSLGDLLPQAERVFSTIGNAGYLAGYLIFNVFLAVYLLISPGGRRPQLARLNLGLAILLQLAALLLAGTRGAWLGLAAGVFLGLALTYIFVENKTIKKYALSVLVAVVILISLPFVFKSSSLVQNSVLLKRATSVSLSDATVQSRLLLWQKAWQAWQQKPLLGWGPENFNVAANKYADARLTEQEAYDFDRAHNLIFDYGVTGGWLGLVSYLGLLGVALWGLWEVARRSVKNYDLAILFGSLLVAYLVQNLFIFDTFVSYLMLFFVLALVSGFWQDRKAGEVEGKKSLDFTKKIIISFIVFCLLFSIYCFNIKPMLASYRAGEILALPPASAQQAAPLLKDALDLKTFASGEIVYQAAVDYIIKIDQSPALADNENFYQISSAGLKEAIVRSPSQARNYVALAWLDLYFSNQHPEALKEVLELAKKIKELSPTKKDVYLILAADYALRGDKILGEQTVAEAQQISPIIGEEVKEYWESLK